MTESKQPWKLWGNSETVTSTSSFTIGQHQLAHIAYHRPETWTFFFEAKLIELNNANLGSLNIVFDLSFGLGRSQTIITAFEQYSTSWLAGAFPANLQFWSATVGGPLRNPPLANVNTNVIDKIPAQNIDCICRTTYLGVAPSDSVTFEVSAYFAPSTHVRPDWEIRDFNAGELEGQ